MGVESVDEMGLAASVYTSDFQNSVDAYQAASGAGQGPSENVQETVEDTSAAAVDTVDCAC
jgi:hypothetical protein